MLDVLDGNTLEGVGLDSREGGLSVWKLDETGLGSCPITGFGVGCLGFSDFATRLLVACRKPGSSWTDCE